MSVFVFGYGSLMWNPGFKHNVSTTALLRGWHRAWCVRSTVYRGCDVAPGFVLGLKKGGSCVGVLFEIEDKCAADVLRLLHEREMREKGYCRQALPVIHGDGIVEAITYTSDGLPDPAHAEFDAAYETARGVAGATREYVERTRAFIKKMPVPSNWPAAEDGLPVQFSFTGT